MVTEQIPQPPASYVLVVEGSAEKGDIAWSPLEGWLKIMPFMVDSDVSVFYALARKTEIADA